MKYRKYNIELNDDGKIECRELDIMGETLDEVKKAIRATEVVQATKPKIKVLYRTGVFSEYYYAEGTTTGRVTTNKYERVWLTYTNKDGRTKREKVSSDYLYLDTPENRKLTAQIDELSKQEAEITREISDLQYQLKKL